MRSSVQIERVQSNESTRLVNGFLDGRGQAHRRAATFEVNQSGRASAVFASLILDSSSSRCEVSPSPPQKVPMCSGCAPLLENALRAPAAGE